MTFKSRLARLEQANYKAVHKGALMVLRTAEQKRIEMMVWLHCHQIMNDSLDRSAALAYARELHETPVTLSRSCPPVPAEVARELAQLEEQGLRRRSEDRDNE